MPEITLAVVGGGTMAQAILRGALGAGALSADAVLVAEPDHATRDRLGQWGVATVERASAFAGRLTGATRILLAVKPQMLSVAGADLAGAADGRGVISILAGSTIARLGAAVGAGARIVRTMPNLPARIGKGVTALAPAPDATLDDRAFARTLFECVGEVIDLDEPLMDAFTAIAGSGPAYVFYLAEALRDAGAQLGLEPADTLRIVRATIAGAGALLAQSADDPADLRAAVTSKKGTTDAAITALENAGVRAAFERAAVAARDRGAELAAL